jgi:hypothetical protein
MDEHKLVTLKLIGFNELEQSNLKAVLTLAERALQNQWQLVDSATADFYLLSVASSAQLHSNDSLKALPAAQRIMCVSKAEHSAGHSLIMDEKRIPGLRALVEVLNRVSLQAAPVATEMIESAAPAAVIENAHPVPISEADIDDTTYFEPHQGLLGDLLQPKQHYLVITLDNQIDCLALYVDIKQRIYYTHNTLAQLDAYLTARDSLFIKSYTAEEFNECIEAENLKPQSLKNLIWYAAITLSAGRVIKNHDNNAVVSLKSWPDLRLPSCMNYAKLAAFMKNNAATLQVIAEKTGIARADVHNFYNACYLLGIID